MKTIELIKIRNWYIPGDAASYLALRKIGLASLKIHRDFIPTLSHYAKPHGIRARVTSWDSFWAKKQGILIAGWSSVAGRSAKMGTEEAQFDAPNSDRGRRSVNLLDHQLTEFFARWGHVYSAVYSETPTKIRLNCTYRFDPLRNPVVPTEAPVVPRSYSVVLGFSRIQVTFYDTPSAHTQARNWKTPLVLLETQALTGTDWKTVHTSTFSDAEIGDLTPFLAGLSVLHERKAQHVGL